MKTIQNSIEFLKTVKKRGVKYYCHNATSEGLVDYLSGFSKASLLLNESISDTEFISSRFRAIETFGWKASSANPKREMKEKNLSDEEIIQALLNIEIETWRIIEIERETVIKIKS